MKRFISLVILTLVLAACGRPDISGDYVALSTGTVSLLQITETPDGHIQGTWERTQIENSGMLSTNHFVVAGTTDGHSITLSATASNPDHGVSHTSHFGTIVVTETIASRQAAVWKVNRSGTVSGNTISLVSPYRTVEYRRGTPDEYYSAYRKLVTQSGKVAMENYQRQQAMLRAEKNANGSH